MVKGIIHFMDGTTLMLRWPKQSGSDSANIVPNVTQSLEGDRILAEAGDRLLTVLIRNIKYIEVTQAPVQLAEGVP